MSARLDTTNRVRGTGEVYEIYLTNGRISEIYWPHQDQSEQEKREIMNRIDLLMMDVRRHFNLNNIPYREQRWHLAIPPTLDRLIYTNLDHTRSYRLRLN